MDIKRLKEHYGDLSDEALLEAYSQGAASYEPAAWVIVAEEVEARGMGGVARDLAAAISDHRRRASDETPPSELSADEVAVALDRARRQSGCAFWWLVGGIVVTAGTWVAASESGATYVIAWGAIVFGLLRMIQSEVRLKTLAKHVRAQQMSKPE